MDQMSYRDKRHCGGHGNERDSASKAEDAIYPGKTARIFHSILYGNVNIQRRPLSQDRSRSLTLLFGNLGSLGEDGPDLFKRPAALAALRPFRTRISRCDPRGSLICHLLHRLLPNSR